MSIKIKMYSVCGCTNHLGMVGMFLSGYMALNLRTRVFSVMYYAYCEVVCSKHMLKF